MAQFSVGVSLDLSVNNNTFTKLIVQELAEQLNERVRPQFASIEQSLKAILKASLKASPEYGSLMRGFLRAELGLDNPQSRVDTVIDVWVNSVKVEFIPFTRKGNNLDGGIRVTAIQADFEDVFNIPESTIHSKRGDVFWTEWLLTKGGQTVVRDFNILYASRIGKASFRRSRSGEAIMVRRLGQSWSVPHKPIAGSVGDNWITRIIDGLEDDVLEKLERTLD